MIDFFLNRKITLFSVYAIIFILGGISLFHLPIELYPEVSYPELTITVNWRGSSPESVERHITRKIESAVNKLRGIKRTESQSSRGSSSITVKFKRSVDIEYRKTQIKELISTIEFPESASLPTVKEEAPGEFERKIPFVLSMYGPLSREEMSELAEEVKSVLERVRGVKRVNLYGDVRRILNIKVKNPECGVYDILEEFKKRDRNCGEITISGRDVSIQLEKSVNPDKIQVKGLPISEQAEINSVKSPPSVISRINGNPVITLQVRKRRNAGLLQVSGNLRERLKGISKPPGVKIEFSRDEADEIRETMRNIGILALISIVIVSLVFFATMKNRFSVLIFFLTITFSSILTLTLLYFFDLSLNVLTLSGIALGFGLVVDNSIIVMENILRLKEEGDRKPEAHGAGQVFLPVFAATLTTISVYIPFLFFQGTTRLYYIPFALSSTFTLLSSIFVSFTLTPFLAKKLIPIVSYRPEGFQRVLRKFTRFKYFVLGAGLLLTGGGIYIFTNLVRKGEIWQFRGGNTLWVRIKLPSGSRKSEALKIADRFEKLIKKNPVYENFYTKVYSKYARIEIDLPENPVGAFLLKEKLENLSTRFANCRIYVVGMGPAFYTGGGRMRGIPHFSLSGYDYYRLKLYAGRLKRKLERHPRIREVDINYSWYGNQKEYKIEPGETMALYGLFPIGVSGKLRQSISSPLYTGQGRMRVKIFKDSLISISDLGKIPVEGGIQLDNICRIRENITPGMIQRENQQYRRDIAYEFRGPFRMAADFKDAFLKSVHLPEGFSLEKYRFYGREEGIKKKEIAISIGLALFLLLIILSSLYESFIKPLLILLVLPLSFFGVALVYFLTSTTFNTGAFVGLILLTGIAVNDGIVLIDHLSRGEKQNLPEIIKRSGHRFRPIIITSLTTILGLFPFVFMESEGQIFSKLALSCLGGLIFSTIGSLLILPVIYYMFFSGKEEN